MTRSEQPSVRLVPGPYSAGATPYSSALGRYESAVSRYGSPSPTSSMRPQRGRRHDRPGPVVDGQQVRRRRRGGSAPAQPDLDDDADVRSSMSSIETSVRACGSSMSVAQPRAAGRRRRARAAARRARGRGWPRRRTPSWDGPTARSARPGRRSPGCAGSRRRAGPGPGASPSPAGGVASAASVATRISASPERAASARRAAGRRRGRRRRERRP